MNSRIERESKTVKKMIELYCRNHHSTRQLCTECSALVEYAQERLSKCPFQGGKTTCTKCSVHCYNPMMRDRIRIMMRYSGPRMLYYHPVATIQYLFDGRRQKPIIQIVWNQINQAGFLIFGLVNDAAQFIEKTYSGQPSIIKR